MADRLSHRVEHLLVRGLDAAVGALPIEAADRIGGGIGALIHRPLGIRRAVVVSNLRRAFPDAAEAWVERTARAAYRHLGRETVAMMRLARLSRDEVLARTEVVGWPEFEAAAAEGRGLVLATGHFGNWEVGAAAIAARGLPTSAIVKGLRNRRLAERLDAARRGLGVETIAYRDAPRLVPRALRAGRVVGIVADQDAGGAGVWVPFFGVPASAHRGPALFALRLRAPLFAGAAFRLPDGVRYRIVLERVPVPPAVRLEAGVANLTAELAARLEAAVRLAPDQYFWFHRRWKSAPPTELRSGVTGTNGSDEGVALSEEDQV